MRPRSALIPVMILMVLDFCFTLEGQPAIYWQGDYQCCIEICPFAKFFLKMGPWHFIIAYAFWFAMVCVVVRGCQNRFGIFVVMLIYSGHLWGSTHWLPAFTSALLGVSLSDSFVWFVSVIYFCFISLTCGVCFNSYQMELKASEPLQ